MILIAETSAEMCSVAIAAEDGSCLAYQKSELPFSHAESLPVMCDSILKNLETQGSKLSAVAISAGPGSYTGLRIGTSLAKGICFARNIPLISLSGLRGMATEARSKFEGDFWFLSNLDARRNEFYMQIFDPDLRAVSRVSNEFTSDKLPELVRDKPLVFCGNASEKIVSALEDSKNCSVFQTYPDAAFLCVEAAQKWISGDFENLAYFEPDYVKAVYFQKGQGS